MQREKLIAVATSDGETINAEFGKAATFDIYRIVEGEAAKAEFIERRQVPTEQGESAQGEASLAGVERCSGGACNGGCGCSSAAGPRSQARLDAVSDCICVLCAHAGPGAKKALAAKAVTVFDIALPVARALPKVVAWYTRAPKARQFN